MSYQQAVLKDNPIALFPLDLLIRNYYDLSQKYATYATLKTSFATYGAMNQGATDLSSISNTPTFAGISGIAPIVIGNSAACSISNSSLVTITNKYKGFAKDSINGTFSGEFIFSFNNLLNGQNGLYDWNILNYPTNNSLNDGSSTNINIFYVKNSTTTTALLFYEKSTNTFRFRVYGAGTSYVESYYVVKELDTQYHIYFSYSNRSINLVVNNNPGISATVSDTSLFAAVFTDINYKIDGSTLKTNESFSISNLAFYDYILNTKQINNHMIWMFNDDKPIKSSLATNNNLFTLQDTQEMYAYRKIFIGKGFKSGYNTYNLNVLDNGLTPILMKNVVFNNLDGASTISYSATDGVSWTGATKKAAIDFKEFGSIATVPGTITLLVKPTNATEYILSIDKVQGSSTLYLERVSGTPTYNLKYYDAENGGVTTTLGTASGNASTTDKIAISFTNNSITLNVNGTASTASRSISFSKNSILTLGQSYHLGNAVASLRANASSFSYLSITDNYITSFPTTGTVNIQDYSYTGGYPWTSILKFSLPLTSNLVVNQKGYWTTSIPLNSMANIIGSKIDWTSMNNCIVEYSIDNGTTWKCVQTRGAPLSGFNFAGTLKNILVRVTLVTNYTVSNYNQSFNELEIGFYKNMNFYSEGERFLLTPGSRDTLYKSTFTTKINPYQVISKPNNIGLFFSYDPITTSVPGFATINNINTQGITAVDMWVRPDVNLTNGKLLTGNSSIAGYPDLYIDASNKLAFNNTSTSSLYVNGYKYSSGSYPVGNSDSIHIAFIFSSYTGDLYINGTSASPGVEGSYGFINLWQYTPNSWDIASRYNLFVSNNTSILSNDNSMNDLLNKVLINSTATNVFTHRIGV